MIAEKKISILLLFVIILLLLQSMTLSFAAEENGSILYVGSGIDDDYRSIQEAIDNASHGDTIIVSSGIYYGQINITKSISIQGENKKDTILDGENKNTVVHFLAQNIDFKGFTIQNSGETTIVNLTRSSGNYFGLFVKSNGNTISNCTVKNCGIAIILRGVQKNTLSNIDVINNKGGIIFYDVFNNDLHTSKISMNSPYYGVFLTGASTNVNVSNCEISYNSGLGASIANASYNTFFSNTFLENDYAVRLFQPKNRCRQNLFYQNDFLNNDVHAYDECNNTWDNGQIGNYWDDYSGVDDDNDGVGDSPYSIPLISMDYYPSMTRFSSIPTDSTFTLQITSPSENEIVKDIVTIQGEVGNTDQDVFMSIKIDEKQLFSNEKISGNNWKFEWNTTMNSNGYHSVHVYALDNSETILDSESVLVKVNNSLPPEIVFLSPSENETVNGSVQLFGYISGNSSRVSYVEIKIGDDTTWQRTWFNRTIASWQYEWNSTAYTDGKYPVYVSAFDDDNTSVDYHRIIIYLDNDAADSTNGNGSSADTPNFTFGILLCAIFIMIGFLWNGKVDN